MSTVYWLLLAQGIVGAFDTLYFHEWRARLPARVPDSSPELKLHALRDFIYAILFGTLPWLAWHGAFAVLLALMLLAEIVITLADFVVEARVRRMFGDVYRGERVTHAVMGIVYGAMLASFVPMLWVWRSQPTGLLRIDATDMTSLRWVLSVMAVGVFLSGARDLFALTGSSAGRWPWSQVP